MRLENLNIGVLHHGFQPGVEQAPGGQGFRRLRETLAVWRARARQRAELARLSPELRRDLGITEADVWRETRKAPWQA